MPVVSSGAHYPLPVTGDGTTGLGKSLRSITHSLRPDIPIVLGAEGPRNISLAAEICDGWLPLFYMPRLADTYNCWLDEGFARPGARRGRASFEVCASAQIVITDDVRATLTAMKPKLALYLGGMDAEDSNFHADRYRRMSYGDVVDEVTRAFRSGRKEEAAQAIPDELIGDVSIVGDRDHVLAQIGVWQAAGVTTMVVGARSVAHIRELASLLD